MVHSSAKNEETEDGTRLRMNSVGPARKMIRPMTSATIMLMFDSARMPRLMPETAETTNAAVSTVTITTSPALPTGPMPATNSRPLEIWSAPMPSVTAVPNSVTMMAKTSMIAPAQPSVRSLKIGAKIAEISGGRPRR